MNITDEQKLILALKKDGFSDDEIENIIAGMKDLQEGNVYTAEEAYKILFLKEKVYA